MKSVAKVKVKVDINELGLPVRHDTYTFYDDGTVIGPAGTHATNSSFRELGHYEAYVKNLGEEIMSSEWVYH